MMKKTFSSRRVPRKVAQDEEEADTAGSEPTIKRPSAKPRKSSNLRTSFGPIAREEDDDSGVVTPKRKDLSRVAIQRNASKRASLLREDDDDRPSYSTASLQELKASTPSTPANVSTDDEADVQDVSEGTRALDLSSKFGSSLARYQQPSAIPSATEIAEKKARRARMAKEQAAEEYISLDPDDPGLDNEEDDDPNVTRDESGKLILKPVDKYGMSESRLVHEDEDIMENFDDFTEDGKMLLGRKAEAEAARKRRVDMAAQIAAAEDSESGEDSDASEKERNAAFEAAQTRHGTYAANTTSADPYESLRPKTPPKISPLPTLDGVLDRLKKQLSEMQVSRARKLGEMDALQREKIRLGEEEVRIQKALRETAEKFQAIRRERGITGAETAAVEAPAGLALEAPRAEGDAEDEVDGDGDGDGDGRGDTELTAHAGLGFSSSEWMGAPRSGLGSMRPPSDEDDY